jgi:hypothetical protein
VSAEAATPLPDEAVVISHHRWHCQEEAAMASIGTESIPTTWDDEHDTAFFRITASLFPGDFTYGAGVLLGGYDNECVADTANTTTVPTSVTPAVTVPTPSVTVR